MSDMSTQMEALDDFVAKARSHNGRFHEAQLGSLDSMANNVREMRSAVDGQLNGLGENVEQLQEDMDVHAEDLQQSALPLQEHVRQPLAELRENVHSHPMKEYLPTGATPQKRRYDYPSELPSTESHDGLRSRHRTSKQFSALPFDGDIQPTVASSSPVSSPTKRSYVYSDAAEEVGTHPPPSSFNASSNTGLREVNINVARPLGSEEEADTSAKPETPAQIASADLDETSEKDDSEPPLKKRRSTSNATSTIAENKLPHKMLSKKMAGMMEGRENVPPSGIAGRRNYRNGSH
jgi:kinesin family protein 11